MMPAGLALDLDIAHIRLRLRASQPGLLHALQASLPSSAARVVSPPPDAPPVDVELELSDLRPHPGAPCAADARPSFEAGRLHLSHPRLQACIDARAGRGRLRLAADEPLADLDYLLRLAAMLAAFEGGGLILHAAAVADRRGARVFYGPSGSGKTSIARRAAPRRVLHDDLVLLQPGAGAGEPWTVHGTPFSGRDQVAPEGLDGAPLRGLYQLGRAEDDSPPRLEPLGAAEGLASLLASTPVIPLDPGRLPTLLERVGHLLDRAPVARLLASLDARSWALLDGQEVGG